MNACVYEGLECGKNEKVTEQLDKTENMIN